MKAKAAGGDALEGATWLDANWMFVGPYIGLLCILRAQGRSLGSIEFLAWVLVPIYALHQFEENAYDFHWHRYAYQDFFNSMVTKFKLEISVRQITLVNIITVWVGFPLAAWRLDSDGDELPAAFQWAMATFHGSLHLVSALIYGYNPGAAQSLIMVPLGVQFLRLVGQRHGRQAVFAALAYGGPVSHFIAAFFPLRLVQDKVITDKAFALVQALVCCVLPLAVAPIFRSAPAAPAKNA
mmetsp:Transcript_35594/g.62890  ORF Transcript_35594/g.62890 Transcript_35594/m.62890 type:complete len:239 (-) Transcript_35594:94-810(-)